jgi:hypothetical protein
VLRRTAGSRRLRIELATGDEARIAEARRLVAGWPGVYAVELAEQGLEAAVDAALPAHQLLRDLVQAGFEVSVFAPVDAGLSDVFMRLTARSSEGAA